MNRLYMSLLLTLRPTKIVLEKFKYRTRLGEWCPLIRPVSRKLSSWTKKILKINNTNTEVKESKQKTRPLRSDRFRVKRWRSSGPIYKSLIC